MEQLSDVLDLVPSLKARGEAFALATVVRTVAATAAKAGVWTTPAQVGTTCEYVAAKMANPGLVKISIKAATFTGTVVGASLAVQQSTCAYPECLGHGV